MADLISRTLPDRQIAGWIDGSNDPLAHFRSTGVSEWIPSKAPMRASPAIRNPQSAIQTSPRFRPYCRLQIAARKRQLESLDYSVEEQAPLLGREAGFEHRDPVFGKGVLGVFLIRDP